MSKTPISDKSEPKEPIEVARISAPHHEWIDDGYRSRNDTASGNDEHERRCRHCGLVKITIHYPFGIPGRAWRTKGAERFPNPGTTPICEPTKE
jgi:hypothetical protein